MLCMVDYDGFLRHYYNSILASLRINISCSYNVSIAKRKKYQQYYLIIFLFKLYISHSKYILNILKISEKNMSLY